MILTLKKTTILALFISTFIILTVNRTVAAELNLASGESALIQANVTTRASCGSAHTHPGDGSAQCYQENANMKVQINQLQNDLYLCRSNNNRPRVWNCTYTCSGNNGMGSNMDKAIACREAKTDSGVQCSSQCECTQD